MNINVFCFILYIEFYFLTMLHHHVTLFGFHIPNHYVTFCSVPFLHHQITRFFTSHVLIYHVALSVSTFYTFLFFPFPYLGLFPVCDPVYI